MDAGLGEWQEFSGQRRRKGISGRKNSMCVQRQRVVEASGVFWNLWESGCLCGHMGCGVRWRLAVHHAEELGLNPSR